MTKNLFEELIMSGLSLVSTRSSIILAAYVLDHLTYIRFYRSVWANDS
ncbi:hypothetical protein [Pajaroellobacter abortibovis]|nr:hypothetical protein [Pajaroellobacter abortibovis]